MQCMMWPPPFDPASMCASSTAHPNPPSYTPPKASVMTAAASVAAANHIFASTVGNGAVPAKNNFDGTEVSR